MGCFLEYMLSEQTIEKKLYSKEKAKRKNRLIIASNLRVSVEHCIYTENHKCFFFTLKSGYVLELIGIFKSSRISEKRVQGKYK